MGRLAGWIVVVSGIGFGLLFFVGIGFPIQILYYMLFGWLLFLLRVGSGIDWSWGDIAFSLGCIAGLFVGLYYFVKTLNPEPHDDDSPEAGFAWTPGISMALMAMLMFVFVAGIAAVGTVHETLWIFGSKNSLFDSEFRYVVGRSDDANRIRQVAISTHIYHDRVKRLPAGTVFGPDNQLMHGWLTMLTPYLELDDVYRQIDLDEPWDSPRNQTAFKMHIRDFESASLSTNDDLAESDYPKTDFSANVHVIGPRPAFNLEDITDGTSRTLLTGLVTEGQRPWGHPANWRDPATGLTGGVKSFGSPYPAGVPMALADGSVRIIDREVDPEVLYQLAHPGDGGTPLDF